MTTHSPSLCLSCVRARPDLKSCQAFPKGIPDSILFEQEDHRVPVSGDHGLQYLFDPSKKDQYEDWLFVKGEISPTG